MKHTFSPIDLDIIENQPYEIIPPDIQHKLYMNGLKQRNEGKRPVDKRLDTQKARSYDLITKVRGRPVAENVRNCMTDTITFGCKEHTDQVRTVALGCDERRVCPTCGEKYSRESAYRVRERLRTWKFQHCAYLIFTLPEDLREDCSDWKEGLKTWRGVVIKTLKQIYGKGVGGFFEYHLWGDEDGVMKPHLNVLVPDLIKTGQQRYHYLELRIKDLEKARKLYAYNLNKAFNTHYQEAGIWIGIRQSGAKLNHAIKYISRILLPHSRIKYPEEGKIDILGTKPKPCPDHPEARMVWSKEKKKFQCSECKHTTKSLVTTHTIYEEADFLPKYSLSTAPSVHFRGWFGFLSNSVWKKNYGAYSGTPVPLKEKTCGTPLCEICNEPMEQDSHNFQRLRKTKPIIPLSYHEKRIEEELKNKPPDNSKRIQSHFVELRPYERSNRCWL